jgi:FAD synthetase
MGNRLTDPYSSKLSPIEASSPGWPEFIRIFPVLAWDYTGVWHFLREFNLPYCCLYDRGFTSLGEKHNSRPNPHLLREDGQYNAAYELADDTLERLSRC